MHSWSELLELWGLTVIASINSLQENMMYTSLEMYLCKSNNCIYRLNCGYTKYLVLHFSFLATFTRIFTQGTLQNVDAKSKASLADLFEWMCNFSLEAKLIQNWSASMSFFKKVAKGVYCSCQVPSMHSPVFEASPHTDSSTQL